MLSENNLFTSLNTSNPIFCFVFLHSTYYDVPYFITDYQLSPRKEYKHMLSEEMVFHLFCSWLYFQGLEQCLVHSICSVHTF